MVSSMFNIDTWMDEVMKGDVLCKNRGTIFATSLSPHVGHHPAELILQGITVRSGFLMGPRYSCQWPAPSPRNLKFKSSWCIDISTSGICTCTLVEPWFLPCPVAPSLVPLHPLLSRCTPSCPIAPPLVPLHPLLSRCTPSCLVDSSLVSSNPLLSRRLLSCLRLYLWLVSLSSICSAPTHSKSSTAVPRKTLPVEQRKSLGEESLRLDGGLRSFVVIRPFHL